MDAVGDRGHRRAVVRVVWRGDEHDIELLGVLVEHLAPVSVAFGVVPAIFAEDAVPRVPIDLGEGDALQAVTVAGTGVGTGASSGGDVADLEFFVLAAGAEDAREGERRCGEARVA